MRKKQILNHWTTSPLDKPCFNFHSYLHKVHASTQTLHMLFSMLKVQRTKLKASQDKDYVLYAIDMKRSSWDTYSYVYFLCIKMYSDSLLYIIVDSVYYKKTESHFQINLALTRVTFSSKKEAQNTWPH